MQGLRCDLAGAAARLSDMAGELSEGQKLQLEELRSTNSQHVSMRNNNILTYKIIFPYLRIESNFSKFCKKTSHFKT